MSDVCRPTIVPVTFYGPNNQLQTIVEVAHIGQLLDANVALPDLAPWYADKVTSGTRPFSSAYDLSFLSKRVRSLSLSALQGQPYKQVSSMHQS